MGLNRKEMYRMPWSKTDNPGGWVEVTDKCNLHCPGCYRHSLEGHRPLEEVKEDIIAVRDITNCDRIGIAGGEPLLYPHIIDVVDFVARNKMKPLLITNGEGLTGELALEFKKAGLAKYHFHVDQGMKRPNWTGKSEVEMNELRQHFADLVWDVGGVLCGFNITIFKSSLKYLPDIVQWARANIHKVHHVSLITYRAIPLKDDLEYIVKGNPIDASRFQHSSGRSEDIEITSDEMFAVLEENFSEYRPAAFLNGTSVPEIYKFLITINIGSKKGIYGFMGAKSVELVQIFHHLIKGKYFDFLRNQKVGRKVFLLSIFDKEIRKTFKGFFKAVLKNPLRFFEKIYVQSISLQQPNELIGGSANLCDGCLNMMIHKGELIPSCRLDEYRIFGGAMIPIMKSQEKNREGN